MMSIRVVSRGGEALEPPPSVVFGEAGGDIGRGADCTLVLPDPERRISRKHALISCRAGQHFIRQIGANLNVEMDGVPLAPGLDHALAPGAQIRIGPYLLQAGRERADPLPHEPLDGIQSTGRPARQSLLAGVLRQGAQSAGDVDLLIDPTTPPAAEALLQALYGGLGVAAPALTGRSAEQLGLIGALLREAVDGTLQLLAARAVAKREFGADPTLLQTRENNPLKFSPHVEAALVHLLEPSRPGFIDPLAAIVDAFDDLRAHEVAMLAGMRAALDAVLTRFDPQALEPRLASKALWENLVPAARKARLWERYGEEYAQIMREIDADFDSLFGRAFLKAYEAQLARSTGAPAEP